MTLVERARALATARHEGQRYGGRPYTFHLQQVADEVQKIETGAFRHFATPDEMTAAAWLHDVLEDTKTTYDEVVAETNATVATLVRAVTDEAGATRKERKLATYPKLRAVGPAAVALKLADRTANVRCARADRRDGLLAKYRDEHAAFASALHIAGEGLDETWRELEALLAPS